SREYRYYIAVRYFVITNDRAHVPAGTPDTARVGGSPRSGSHNEGETDEVTHNHHRPRLLRGPWARAERVLAGSKHGRRLRRRQGHDQDRLYLIVVRQSQHRVPSRGPARETRIRTRARDDLRGRDPLRGSG